MQTDHFPTIFTVINSKNKQIRILIARAQIGTICRSVQFAGEVLSLSRCLLRLRLVTCLTFQRSNIHVLQLLIFDRKTRETWNSVRNAQT